MLFPPSPWLCPSMGCSPVLRLRVWISLVTCWVPKRILILAKFRTEGPVQDLHPKWRPVNFFHHRLRQFQRRRKIVHQFPINFDCWIRDIFVSSLKSYEANQELSVQQTSKFFKDVEEFPLDLCLSVSTGCRPHPWIDMLAIFAIENLLGQLTDKCQEDQIKMKSFAFVRPLV
jgi:hypothetical protein